MTVEGDPDVPVAWFHFEALNPAQRDHIESLPGWTSTQPQAGPEPVAAYVSFRIQTDDVDEASADVERMLAAEGLPEGRRAERPGA